jgi:hypothetical protein
MAHGAGFWTAQTQLLDEGFDAPDVVADRQLCQAIGAGKAGLHPDGWGAHDPLTTLPPHHREPFVPPVGYPADHSVEWKPHTPRPKPWRPQPWVPPPRWSAWHPHTPSSNDAPAHGTLQLTCDVCNRARFGDTVGYYGDRPKQVAAIRALGHKQGWTCIAGTDRCPRCSQAAAPEPVGDGAGGNQGDEQHR